MSDNCVMAVNEETEINTFADFTYLQSKWKAVFYRKCLLLLVWHHNYSVHREMAFQVLRGFKDMSAFRCLKTTSLLFSYWCQKREDINHFQLPTWVNTECLGFYTAFSVLSCCIVHTTQLFLVNRSLNRGSQIPRSHTQEDDTVQVVCELTCSEKTGEKENKMNVGETDSNCCSWKHMLICLWSFLSDL